MNIYFKHKGILRDFYFVSVGGDKSIYFGSVAAKSFVKGCNGNGEILDGVGRIEYGQNIRPLTDCEKNSKYSFHKLGVFFGSADEKGQGSRYELLPLEKLDGPIPLAGIIPMRIDKYPTAKHKATKKDVFINFPQEIFPFGTVIYLKRSREDEPKLFLQKDKWNYRAFISNKLGEYFLGVFIYVPRKPFTAWQRLELNIVARSKDDQKVPLWPIVG